MSTNSELEKQADRNSAWDEETPRSREFKRIISVFFGRPLPVVGLVIIVLIILTAIFAPLLAPYDPLKMDVPNRLKGPTAQNWLGTDEMGRDTLSRVIYGSRVSLLIGFASVCFSAMIGIPMGLLAAYSGGIVHNIIMRFTDGLMSFPMILIALLIATILGGGTLAVIIALIVGQFAPSCRMTCAMAMSVKENDYVLAARTMGMRKVSIMLNEILPNCFAPILVTMTIGLGAAILAEASLSFLGVGVNPPTAVWGRMVNEGYKFLLISPILSIAPGLAIMLVVFGFNMMGDGLRDALDPRLRGVI
ncbi:MAG TPA: ABC transporter permease [Dehalococcoidales bacterium]|nr:ABC transporter permease [Dehalococcoidales bacterium]